MKKRKIFASATAAALIAILAFGTLAYFTAQNSIENTFMTFGYDPDNPPTADELFSISVYETDNTKTDGSVTTTGNTYDGVLPGDTLKKDPTIENTGKYSAYIRLHVTFSNAAEWKAILGDGVALTTLLDDVNTGALTVIGVTEDASADTISYDYYLTDALAAGGKVTLFQSVTIPVSLTVEQFVTISRFTVSVSAEAIQESHTGDTPAEAFVLYDAQENQS